MLAPGPSGNRSSRPVRIGESISGWEVVEIHEKSVIVTANGIRETVAMNDLPRVYDKTVAATGAPPAVNVTPSAAAAPPAAAPTPSQPQSAPAASQQPKQCLVHSPFGDVMMNCP